VNVVSNLTLVSDDRKSKGDTGLKKTRILATKFFALIKLTWQITTTLLDHPLLHICVL